MSDDRSGSTDDGSGNSPSLPTGVTYREFGDESEARLATRGRPVYGERTEGEWRLWDPRRSKVGAMYEKGLDLRLGGGKKVLYLGAASGTTASHVADFSRCVYAVEFAARPVRDLVGVAEDRSNLFPLLEDARKPASYAHVVEPVDALIQDVATRGQAGVARANQRFLADDGVLILTVKARSEDVTGDPADVFESVLADLREAYEVLDTERLEPFHDAHLAVVARPR
ncbi:fibrillin [Halobacteriales archaeon QH_8_64_26]|nr:MAG: fibrillin [Halobacteriales archaeon QH_8_64_26]